MGLQFLNLALAGGIAAIAAPVIIHLIHRSKVVKRDWGAMIFLEEIIAERSKKIKLQEWLLLLVRMLILAMIAMAMMHPAIMSTLLGARSPDTHTSVVILIDDSYSMNVGSRGGIGRTALQEAKERALKYVETLHKGDDVAIMLTSNAGKGEAPAVLLDFNRMKEVIRGVQIRAERTEMPRAITAALTQLEQMHNPARELAIFSDEQGYGWEVNDAARWTYIAHAIKSSRVKPVVIVSGPDEKSEVNRDNAALVKLASNRNVVDTYSPVTFTFTVANSTENPIRDVAVTFMVDGAPKTTKTVDLGPNARESVAFDYKFDRPGSHAVGGKLRCPQDTLEDDNELYKSILALNKLPVLLVDGDRKPEALASESAFLQLALAPKDDDDPSWRTVVDSTVIDPTELKFTDLTRYRVVVLSNVTALPGSVIGELERFVVAGGGLFITLGDRVLPDIYNRDLYRQGAGLLPAMLKSPVSITGVNTGSGSSDPVKLVSTGGTQSSSGLNEAVHLASIVTTTPALDLFRPEKGQDWTRASIRAYFPAVPPTRTDSGGATEKSEREDVKVLATFSNGDPALIQKKLGEGRVTLFTTAVDVDWSDLAIHPFYVPLMQNLVHDLASTVTPPRDLDVGETLSFIATGPLAAKTPLLAGPDGKPREMKVQRQGNLAIATYENAWMTGVYSVQPEGAPPEEKVYYTVTSDREESDLTKLTSTDWGKLDKAGVHHAQGTDGLLKFIGLGGGGREVSAFFILAAIGFLFLETYLTRRWSTPL
jgi:hypothetical protein